MKKFLAFLLAASFCIGMTACAGNKDTTSTTKPNSTDASKGNTTGEATGGSDEKVEIRVLTRMAGSTSQVQIFKDIIAEFEVKFPNAKVIDESQGDESAFNNKLKTDLASGTLPHIFRIQGVANLKEYIDNGLLMNIDEIIKADPEWGNGLVEGALNYYNVPSVEGTYAVPMESGLIGVFYNQAIFKEAGIETFPKTWTEFKAAIEKIKAIDKVPLALGAKSTYMAGHLHDQIFYKWLGTEAAKKLGTREIKWTDPEVVETLAYIQELNDLGAFPDGAAGISDDIVLTQFLTGEAAMIVTGPWNIGKLSDPEETPFAKDIQLAKFPYFEEKPEFKDDDMQIVSPYMINGKLEGKEKEMTIELIKMLTSKEAAKRFAEEAQYIVPRSDIEIDTTKVSSLFTQTIELGATSKGIAVDVFDFDPLSSMQDRTRNSIVGILVGNTPEQAAQEIQTEIDNAK